MAGEEAAAAAAAAAAEGKGAGSGGGYDRKCVFCRIARREEPGTALFPSEYEDLVCFKDIKPGAPHHYLVVPVEHLGNCKTLKTEHIPLVKRMMEVGKAVLQKNNVSDLSDIRLHSSSGDSLSTTSGDREGPSDSLPRRLFFDYVLKVDPLPSIPEERMGFHWPPFCSIAHLHLHVLAPASQMGFLSRLYYRINSYWFITAEQLLERLQTTNAAS